MKSILIHFSSYYHLKSLEARVKCIRNVNITHALLLVCASALTFAYAEAFKRGRGAPYVVKRLADIFISPQIGPIAATGIYYCTVLQNPPYTKPTCTADTRTWGLPHIYV